MILLGASLGMLRYAASLKALNSHELAFYNGRNVMVEGVVVREPVFRGKDWQLTLRVNRLELKDRTKGSYVSNDGEITSSFNSQNDKTVSVSGLIIMNIPPWPSFEYGDRIALSCKLEKPQNKDFAYDRYLARYGIYSICGRPRLKLLGRRQGNYFYTFLLAIKRRSYSTAETYMPEPTASLALPVVFGGGQAIDDDISDQFRRSGLTHIMAVSGFNVSLLAGLLGFLFLSLGLRRRLAFIATVLTIAAYVLMVGAPASAVRAGVMSIFLLTALNIGRLASLPRAVLLVAVMTLIANPRLLRDDIGWQLSFLALLGLMYILPFLEKWTLALTRGKAKGFVTALMATVAAQIATAPVILYKFGNFSVIAPLANLLVVWVVPILTVAMMLALPLAMLFPSLGSYVFFPCWVMVKYIFFVVEKLADLSWAAIKLGS